MRGKDETSEETLIEKDEEYVTELELKAHQALDVFTEYQTFFGAREKAKADQADILKKEQALSSLFPAENLIQSLIDKKADTASLKVEND